MGQNSNGSSILKGRRERHESELGDGGVSELGEFASSDVSAILHRAEEAIAIGADAVVLLVFHGSPDEEKSLQRLARLASECELLGLPVMAEAIPGGWAKSVDWTIE